MAFIRRTWTPIEADEWTREDYIAMLLSSLAYITLMVGVALSFLLLWQGFVILGVGVVLVALMYYVIDPKLKSISEEYEKKQQAYLDELEASARWQRRGE